MTSSACRPSIVAHETAYYPHRAVPTGNPQGYYSSALSVGGTVENLSGIQTQPRSFYNTNDSRIYSTNEYKSATASQVPSSNASFIASRAGSFDSAFPQSVTPDSGLSSQVDAYTYMYSDNQEPAGLVTTPPTLSPISEVQHHSRKPKAASRHRKGSRHQQSFSPESMSMSSASNRSKLRSASRTSKNTHHNPPASAEERKSRETHNNVEKQYRNRLNAHFESLLGALPESMQAGEGGDSGDCGLDSSDRRVSKAEVLEMARRHIKSLERECLVLENERDELRENMEKLRWLFGRCEGGPAIAEGTDFTGSSSTS
jgi:hypothetical protein